MKKNSNISKENTEIIIKKVNDWGSAMVEQLEKAADEFLARITADFKIDIPRKQRMLLNRLKKNSLMIKKDKQQKS